MGSRGGAASQQPPPPPGPQWYGPDCEFGGRWGASLSLAPRRGREAQVSRALRSRSRVRVKSRRRLPVRYFRAG